MLNETRWRGQTLLLNKKNKFESDILKVIEYYNVRIRSEDVENEYALPNPSSYFVLEDEFIGQTKNFINILNKLSEKDYENTCFVYRVINHDMEEVDADFRDKELYSGVLSNNIVVGVEGTPEISINVLQEVLGENKKSNLVIDIFILFALAHKTTYEAETIKYEFRSIDREYLLELDIIKSSPIHLWPIYNWVFNSREYKDSHLTKLEIVRQVILNKQSIYPTKEILKDCQLCYKRIISQKTNDYFDQLNKLKDDFLVLSKNHQTAVRTMNLTFFAWLGTLGMEVFRIVMDYEGTQILSFLFVSRGPKKAIVILIFIISLIFIWLAYRWEIESLKKEYLVIKNLYIDKIFFETSLQETDKFSEIIIEPSTCKYQKNIFCFLLAVLIIRLIIAV